MGRLIDADVLLEQMKRRKEYVGRPSDPVCLVEDAPTVDAVPVKHGRWEDQSVIYKSEEPYDAEMQSAKCSLCEKYLTTPFLYYFDEYDYCPNCGAKMDGERREEDEIHSGL